MNGKILSTSELQPHIKASTLLKTLDSIQNGHNYGSDIARDIDINPRNCHSNLRLLSNNGIISRSYNPKNERKILVSLSEKGERIWLLLKELRTLTDVLRWS